MSCSTSLRAAFTAESGVALDEPLISSIFLPPAVSFFSFSASSTPRMLSWPSTVNGPSSVASTPILMVSCARRAAPSQPAATAPTREAARTVLANLLLFMMFFSSG